MLNEQDLQRALAQFRQWMELARRGEADTVQLDSVGPSGLSHDDRFAAQAGAFAEGRPGTEPLGMHGLTEAFTSLRHEVKLNTKSVRSLQEELQRQVESWQGQLTELGQKIDAQADVLDVLDSPLLAMALDHDEALERAIATLERDMERDAAHIDDLVRCLTPPIAPTAFWQRFLPQPPPVDLKRVVESWWQARRQPQCRLLEGLVLLRSRLVRELEGAGIERIECHGQPVDPHAMRVMVLADDPSVPDETVVEVLRPGYRLGDQVVRLAEVRATSVRRPSNQEDSCHVVPPQSTNSAAESGGANGSRQSHH